MTRTEITRDREKVRTDRALLDELLDSTWLGHVSLVRPDGWPVVIPTAVVRQGDRLLMHGSTGSPWMRAVAGGSPVSVAITDALIPGRVAEVRASTARELAATLVLALPIEEWSLKVSDAFSGDPDSDIAAGAWAGVVPVVPTSYGDPIPHPNLRPGIPVPVSVTSLTRSLAR